MLHQLTALLLNGVQMVGITVVLIGAVLFAGAIFNGRIGSFVKAGSLMLIGAYLAGFGGSFHP